jgi:O-antigen/teichoic acid export membrane protein
MEAIETIRAEDSESLSKKVVHGGLWVFALRIVNRGLGFIRTIILARLLAPEDFGLLGIGMLSIATIETFSQTGFNHALIQKRGNINSYLDTAWSISAIRGFIVFLILFVSAPLIAKFFNSKEATLVIRVVSLSTLITGFKNVGVLFFLKKLEFNKQFIYEFSGTFFDLTIAITLAFMLRNVWALIWGGLSGNFIRLFMSYLLHPYRPKFKISKNEIKDLFGFGKWVVISGMIGFLINSGDDIIVGKIVGITALGIYQMAFLLSNLPATEITHVVSLVTFPAYSKLQQNIQRLKASYFRVLQVTMFFSAPLAGGIFILSPEFAQIFMGTKWLPMVSAVQVLVVAGLVRSMAGTTGPIFYAVGNPKIETKWQAFRVILMAIFIYPFTMQWGVLGSSIVVLLTTLIATVGYSYEVIKITKCKLKNFLKLISLPSLNTIIMVLIISAVKENITYIGYLKFLFLIAVGCTSYLFIAYLLDVFFNYGIWSIIKEIGQKERK